MDSAQLEYGASCVEACELLRFARLGGTLNLPAARLGSFVVDAEPPPPLFLNKHEMNRLAAAFSKQNQSEVAVAELEEWVFQIHNLTASMCLQIESSRLESKSKVRQQYPEYFQTISV
jgi:hypothetical protein